MKKSHALRGEHLSRRPATQMQHTLQVFDMSTLAAGWSWSQLPKKLSPRKQNCSALSPGIRIASHGFWITVVLWSRLLCAIVMIPLTGTLMVAHGLLSLQAAHDHPYPPPPPPLK